jgi:hypothetical protein
MFRRYDGLSSRLAKTIVLKMLWIITARAVVGNVKKYLLLIAMQLTKNK